MVTSELGHNCDSLANDGRKGRRAGEHDPRRNLAVALQHLLEAVAWPFVWVKGESNLVCTEIISKAISGDQLVVVERLERATDDTDDLLVRVLPLGSYLVKTAPACPADIMSPNKNVRSVPYPRLT